MDAQLTPDPGRLYTDAPTSITCTPTTTINVGCAQTLFYCAQPPVPRLPIYIKGETHLKLEIPSTPLSSLPPVNYTWLAFISALIKTTFKVFSTPQQTTSRNVWTRKGRKGELHFGFEYFGSWFLTKLPSGLDRDSERVVPSVIARSFVTTSKVLFFPCLSQLFLT